jgi:hypothetical protein
VSAFWSTTAPTSQPTANGTTVIDVSTLGGTGPVINDGLIEAYVGLPAAGTWYLSYWIGNNGSYDGGFVFTPIEIG